VGKEKNWGEKKVGEEFVSHRCDRKLSGNNSTILWGEKDLRGDVLEEGENAKKNILGERDFEE